MKRTLLILSLLFVGGCKKKHLPNFNERWTHIEDGIGWIGSPINIVYGTPVGKFTLADTHAASDIEIGLRSDDVVVWRKKEKAK